MQQSKIKATNKMVRYIYRFWQYTFSGPKSIKLNKLLLNLSIRGLGILNYSSAYLNGETAWLRNMLSEVDKPIVFDVGANVGNYTANVVAEKPDCTVYAFEPHPINFERLQKKVGTLLLKKGRVCIINSAVGDVPKKLDLYDRCDREGSTYASLYQKVIEDIQRVESVKFTVDVITLDDFCDKRKVKHIDLLKIDTEGNELKCLRGAQRMLDRKAINAIQFEFNEMNIISHSTFKDFWDLLYDYNIARLLPGGRLLPIKRYSSLMCEIYEYQNIVATLK